MHKDLSGETKKGLDNPRNIPFSHTSPGNIRPAALSLVTGAFLTRNIHAHLYSVIFRNFHSNEKSGIIFVMLILRVCVCVSGRYNVLFCIPHTCSIRAEGFVDSNLTLCDPPKRRRRKEVCAPECEASVLSQSDGEKVPAQIYIFLLVEKRSGT